MTSSKEETRLQGKCILSERRAYETKLFSRLNGATIKNEKDLIISADDTWHVQAVIYKSGKVAQKNRVETSPSKAVK